jgi:KDO2-lipid IV(A) lauroyltransferase
MLYRFDARHRRIALEHLRRSFPDWPESRLEHVARRSMHSMVYLGLEVLYTPRLVTVTRWPEFVRFRGVAEAIRLLLQNRGMIMLTGHFGNWEVLGYTLACLGFPTYSVARRLDNPHLDRFLLGVREDRGQVILDKRGATARIPDLLADDRAVGFIADQDAGRKGAFVDFFGRKASTYKSIALLAIQHNVPVAVGYARRLEDDFRFEIGVERIIHPEEWADVDDPVMWITQEYTSALEQVVRRNPEQYLWVHRRWKHRPRGEPPAEGGIA